MTASERRKASSKLFKALRRSWRKLKNVWPERCPEYLAWLRTQECIRPGCRCKRPYWHPEYLSFPLRTVQACHTGPHGKSVKAPDPDAIPLCMWAHQEAKDAQGKTRTWFEDHGLNRQTALDDLRARYESER